MGLYLVAACGLAAAAALAWVATLSPSNDRGWAADHAVQARVAFEGDHVTIENVRDFTYETAGTFVERYRDETIELDDVRRVWFVLAPFAERWRGLAHSFVSFELTGDRYLAVSVEARREDDERYSLLRGVMRGFELTYVIGTERDLIGLRALRGDSLYLYPSRATPAQARAMFRDMLTRAEAVRLDPEFYHTLGNSCATNLRDHVNRVLTDPLPWGWAVVFPGYSDELALEHGLLDTDLALEPARERFRVDERARRAFAEGRDFSRTIREGPAAIAADPGEGRTRDR